MLSCCVVRSYPSVTSFPTQKHLLSKSVNNFLRFVHTSNSFDWIIKAARMVPPSQSGGAVPAPPSEETQQLYREMTNMVSRVEQSNRSLQKQIEV